jgi:hypothetical protein
MTTGSVSVEELEQVYDRAWRRHDALQVQHRDRRAKLLRAFERQLDAELDVEFKEPLAQALAEKLATKKAWEEVRNAALLSAALATPREILLGTRVEEWLSPKYCPRDPKKPTGRQGVLEVVISTSEHPDNSSYRAPVGTVVVRILKKDGTPSKKYVYRQWSIENEWRPCATQPAAEVGS